MLTRAIHQGIASRVAVFLAACLLLSCAGGWAASHEQTVEMFFDVVKVNEHYRDEPIFVVQRMPFHLPLLDSVEFVLASDLEKLNLDSLQKELLVRCTAPYGQLERSHAVGPDAAGHADCPENIAPGLTSRGRVSDWRVGADIETKGLEYVFVLDQGFSSGFREREVLEGRADPDSVVLSMANAIQDTPDDSFSNRDKRSQIDRRFALHIFSELRQDDSVRVSLYQNLSTTYRMGRAVGSGPPAELATLLREEYDMLLQHLDPEDRSYLIPWRLSIPPPHPYSRFRSLPDSVLRLEARYAPREIVVSADLIRLAFDESIKRSQLGTVRRSDALPDEATGTWILSGSISQNDLQNFFHEFRKEFRFALAHEMAHIYAGKGGLLANELLADCLALRHIQRTPGTPSLGLFESALVASEREGSHLILWGLSSENAALLRKRVERLKTASDQGPLTHDSCVKWASRA